MVTSMMIYLYGVGDIFRERRELRKKAMQAD